MTRVLLVADDLTGADAAAAGFARAGLRTVAAPAPGPEELAAFRDRYDVVAVATQTRHAQPAEAADAVARYIRSGWPADLVSCRIDTTLRGNVGVAVESAVRTVAELSGRHAVGLCAASYPAAKRYTVDGLQLLDGTRLEDTELARDLRTPVRTSSVTAVLETGTGLATRHVSLATVTGDASALRASLADAVRAGADVVVADALTDAHLDRLATAAAELAEAEGVCWVGVDPGPGSAALARTLGLLGRERGAPLLAVSGSASDLTRAQLQTLRAARPVRTVRPVFAPGSRTLDTAATAAELVEALRSAGAGEIVLLATALSAEDLVAVGEDDGYPQVLGAATRDALARCDVSGLYLTGGDVTSAVLCGLGARGLEVTGEVVPLAVVGRLVAGSWTGLPVVTKGGLVGDAGTAVACLDRLKTAAVRSTGSARDPQQADHEENL